MERVLTPQEEQVVRAQLGRCSAPPTPPAPPPAPLPEPEVMVAGHYESCPRARAVLEYQAMVAADQQGCCHGRHHGRYHSRYHGGGDNSLARAYATAAEFQQLSEELNPFSAHNLTRGYGVVDPITLLSVGFAAVVICIGGIAVMNSSSRRRRRPR